METVSSSALKTPLIFFLTSWVRQKIIPTVVKIKEKQTYIEGGLPEQWLRQQEKNQRISHWSLVTFSKNISEQNIYLFT